MRYVLSLLMLYAALACSTNQMESVIPDDMDDKLSDTLGLAGAKYGFQTIVPFCDYDIILSVPSDNSMRISILTYRSLTGYVAFGATGEQLTVLDAIEFEKGKPAEVNLTGLMPDKSYNYYFYYKPIGASSYTRSPLYTFHTTRQAESSYSFAIIADSHLDMNTDILTYQTTMRNVANDIPDFLVDMGDTFMTDKYGSNYTDALGQYLAQRYYFGGVCHSVPLYFVQGNHDGEMGGTTNGIAEWSKQVREKYFRNPVPENYFSWQWGNALMIVLDPYSYTPRQGGTNPWFRTLGETQYRWLETILKQSNAKFKFVFIHNLVGGVDLDGRARGGSEAAPYYEWGGKNIDGSTGFSSQRPNWELTIHDLLKKYGVQVVFHGHDHIYAKQEYDGVIYQCVQQPGLKRFDKLTYATIYGYLSGLIKYDPGHLKVTVNSNSATIDYVATNKEILHSYTLN